ncbi:MAG TPA: C40 family peptidase [Flavobacterium sp.]|nr:C40 family peptidase [Flavobacterium sp.]
MRKTLFLKQLLFLILISIIFTSCKSSAVATSKSNKLAEQIIESASDNIGVRYKYAGTNKSGFDCSGLVFTTFNKFDIKLPRNSEAQSKVGTPLGKNISKAKKGDLVFFKTNGRSHINHVGIVTEVKDEELEFIHASTSRGVIISSTKESYYNRTFAQVNRILP